MTSLTRSAFVGLAVVSSLLGASLGCSVFRRPPAPPPTPAPAPVEPIPLPPPVPTPVLPRLQVVGREITAGGQPFVWRGVTAFRLLDRVAAGQDHPDSLAGAQAVAFLDWARATGFNVVRVLGMLCCWFELTPAEAQAALPRLLELANERTLYVEVTALAGTGPAGITEAQAEAHVAAIGQACVTATNCVIELANENAHPSQQDYLRDEAFLAKLRALVPPEVPMANGSNCCGEADEPPDYPDRLRRGNYLTVHVDRSRDTWHRTRHVRELERLSIDTGKYVVSDEPVGFGEPGTPNRSTDPHEAYAQGALSRIFSLGATLHLHAGLHATVPGPTQQAAAEAFLEGTQVIADDVRLMFKNAGWHDSPVRSFRFTENFGDPNTAIRAYSGITGGTGVTVLVGVTGDPDVDWREPWLPVEVLADRPGVRVVEIRQ